MACNNSSNIFRTNCNCNCANITIPTGTAGATGTTGATGNNGVAIALGTVTRVTKGAGVFSGAAYTGTISTAALKLAATYDTYKIVTTYTHDGNIDVTNANTIYISFNGNTLFTYIMSKTNPEYLVECYFMRSSITEAVANVRVYASGKADQVVNLTVSGDNNVAIAGLDYTTNHVIVFGITKAASGIVYFENARVTLEKV